MDGSHMVYNVQNILFYVILTCKHISNRLICFKDKHVWLKFKRHCFKPKRLKTRVKIKKNVIVKTLNTITHRCGNQTHSTFKYMRK